jgi:hypothetical protein
MAAKKKVARRTVMRSSTGKKLYAVRRADGTFSDIQSYARSSRADQATRSTKETATRTRKAAKRKTTKKRTVKKK